MKGKALIVIAFLLSMAVKAQEDSERPDILVNVMLGYDSYQELPSAFQVDPNAAETYAVRNLAKSFVFSTGVSIAPKGMNFQYGFNLAYENGAADLEEGTDIYRGAYSVAHYTFLGHFKWDYWSTDDNVFSIGGGLYLGMGLDIGTFTEEVPDFSYSQADYHYQLDPINIRVGNSFGLEVSGGYGVLGYVRGGFFYRF